MSRIDLMDVAAAGGEVGFFFVSGMFRIIPSIKPSRVWQCSRLIIFCENDIGF